MINIDDIKVLSGIEAIRLRPTMYLGQLNSSVLSTLIIEAMCILRYRIYKGLASCIEIFIDNDNNIEIWDNGEGDILNEDIFTKLYACKNIKEKDVHHFCELGIIVVNALSEYFNVSSGINNEIFTLKYKKGLMLEPIANGGKECLPHMRFDFKPDTEIFGNIRINLYDLTKSLKKISKDEYTEIWLNGNCL